MRLATGFTEKKALAITLSWVALLAVTGSTEALLFMAPALLIAIPLFAGRYVGEELIVKLAERRPRGRRRPGAAPSLPLPAPPTWLARGARLVAFALAKRPPPALLLTQN